tara:strand:+ start:24775 stop:25338 length:564 start_codon:yes stop_codon:yes gene_type:complete
MDNNFNEKISLDDLFTRKEENQRNTIKIFQKILARAHKKIKTASRQKFNNDFVFFIVPEFLLGVPKYDVGLCTSWVIEKLIDNGFHIKYTHPNLLFISWNHYIPNFKRSEIKKKYGVNIDGFGNLKESKKKKNNNEPENINDLMFKKEKKGILKKDNTKYTSISSYKPTGNLIYNKDLLKSIEDKTK